MVLAGLKIVIYTLSIPVAKIMLAFSCMIPHSTRLLPTPTWNVLQYPLPLNHLHGIFCFSNPHAYLVLVSVHFPGTFWYPVHSPTSMSWHFSHTYLVDFFNQFISILFPTILQVLRCMFLTCFFCSNPTLSLTSASLLIVDKDTLPYSMTTKTKNIPFAPHVPCLDAFVFMLNTL